MNRRLGWLGSLALVVSVAVLLAAGCSHKPPVEGPTETQILQQLPESTNVTAALDQKDYAAAVSTLAKLKDSVSTDPQREAYANLSARVMETLTQAAATDPNAEEALKAMRMVMIGR
jgi:hypothetical protein